MRARIQRLLERYGRAVEVCRDGARTASRGFLQPVMEESWKDEPTPLGTARRDLFLYLGEAGMDLEELGDGFLECGGTRYEVRTAQAVRAGEEILYWWAVLGVRDVEEA